MGSTTGCLPPLVQLMGKDKRLKFQESPFESLKGQGACVWSSILSLPRTKAAKVLKFTYLLRSRVTGHIIYTLYLWILHSFKNLRLTKINIILLQVSRNSINSPPVVPTGIRFRLDKQPLRQLYLLPGLPTLNNFRSEPFAQGSPASNRKIFPQMMCAGGYKGEDYAMHLIHPRTRRSLIWSDPLRSQFWQTGCCKHPSRVSVLRPKKDFR